VCLMMLAGLAKAQLTIEITQTLDSARPIAVLPFTGQQVDENIGAIIRSNLSHSDYFKALQPPEGTDARASQDEGWTTSADLLV
ncbi:hypothetical protein ABTJ06_19570, partial [Acinetobacter baumannii]